MKHCDLHELIARMRTIEPGLRDIGITYLAIFGSYARGEQHTGSDLDVLVDVCEGGGYFALANAKSLLEESLGIVIDIQFRSSAPDPVRVESVVIF